jgi:hypothetical protein
MMTKTAETTIRVVMFNGKKDEFDPWHEKHLARATVKGFKGFLLHKEGDIPESDYDIDADATKSANEKKELKRRKEGKENAFGDLMMSIDTSTPEGLILFNSLKGCKTSKYKDGHAGNAWERIIGKYVPKTAPTLAKLHKTFYAFTLKTRSETG